jgi:hypothetical protein
MKGLRRGQDPAEELRLGHGSVPPWLSIDDDPRHRPHGELLRELRELVRLDRGRRHPLRGEGAAVRQQHGRRAVRSSRRDEDVEREVALELLERRDRFGTQRGLVASGLDDRADEGAELVAPR